MKKFLFISSLFLSSFGLTVSAKEEKFKEIYSQKNFISTDSLNNDIHIFEDTESGVQYLYIQHGRRELAVIAICPRYNLDGTLFK